MDTQIDDKLYRQIEKNLSNNINQDLFSSGRELDETIRVSSINASYEPGNTNNETTDPISVSKHNDDELPYSHSDSEYGKGSPLVSRAEYIRQAREACLRQLSVTQSSRTYEAYQNNHVEEDIELLPRKKNNPFNFLRETAEDVNTEEEIAAYRSLIIRTVCAVVIFLFVFLFDKLQLKLGGFSHEIIREYVTGIDKFGDLESIFVSFFK